MFHKKALTRLVRAFCFQQLIISRAYQAAHRYQVKV